MTATNTIVKETLSKDIRRRSESPPPIPAGAGRKVGEETHIEITPDRIRLRAYEIFQARNGAPGDAASDWAQAERELNGGGPDSVGDANHEAHVRLRGESLLASRSD